MWNDSVELSRIPTYRQLTGVGYRAEEKPHALESARKSGGVKKSRLKPCFRTASGGQQQRVAIARALMQKARLDFGATSPLRSLDPESSRLICKPWKKTSTKKMASRGCSKPLASSGLRAKVLWNAPWLCKMERWFFRVTLMHHWNERKPRITLTDLQPKSCPYYDSSKRPS